MTTPPAMPGGPGPYPQTPPGQPPQPPKKQRGADRGKKDKLVSRAQPHLETGEPKSHSMPTIEARSELSKTVVRLFDDYLEIERAGGLLETHPKGSKRSPCDRSQQYS
jgi:hypothetical protein